MKEIMRSIQNSRRKITEIFDCLETTEGDNVPVTRAFPVAGRMQIDPFLLFDHFGPIHYHPEEATGVPAHPHCGFEAITFMLNGEIEHRDSFGGQANIRSGDVQWMTTGSGLVHSELATKAFRKSGGILEGLQIWVNLPQIHKNVDPGYQHIPVEIIPTIDLQNNAGYIKVIAGEIMGVSSQIKTFSPVSIFQVQLSPEVTVDLEVKLEQTALIYVLAGTIGLQNSEEMASKGQMVQFDGDGDLLSLYTTSSPTPVSLIVLAGQPLNQPIARYGPFVTNTETEIRKAVLSYQSGDMGQL